MELGLQGAKVLVAASRSGLGAATARRFSLDGAEVTINGRDSTTLETTGRAIQIETGKLVHTAPGDVSVRGEATRIVETAAAQLGGLDVLVTNAGGPPSGVFADFELDDWEQGYHLLLASVIELVQAALPYLKLSGRAAILAVTSLTVKQPVDNLVLSNVMRAGIAALVKSLANEYGPHGIRVNAILPGWTATQRMTDLLESRARANNTTPEAEREGRLAAIPLRRMGTPDEFGNVAAFLCSPAAGFIHGAMIPVDGGEIRSTL
ncbi:MAG: SDR family oxidoreductase [Chloroflexi bacterium]|nr:SDR family oxidoreductase [Chloroflexota bacterium]